MNVAETVLPIPPAANVAKFLRVPLHRCDLQQAS